MKKCELIAIMQKVEGNYGIKFTEKQVELWVEFFEDEDKERFSKAINKAIAYYTRMPNIAEINKILSIREITPL